MSIEERLRAAYSDTFVVETMTSPRAIPDLRRSRARNRGRLFTYGAVSAAIVMAVVVLQAEIGGGRAAVHRRPAGSAPIASVANGSVTLRVFAVDRNSEDGTISVTLDYLNTGSSAVDAAGQSVLDVELADQDGPSTEIDKGGPPQKLALARYFSCAPPVASSTLPPGTDRGLNVVLPPPSRTLNPGESYGPYTLCFAVGGPITQSVALRWYGYSSVADDPPIVLPLA